MTIDRVSVDLNEYGVLALVRHQCGCLSASSHGWCAIIRLMFDLLCHAVGDWTIKVNDRGASVHLSPPRPPSAAPTSRQETRLHFNNLHSANSLSNRSADISLNKVCASTSLPGPDCLQPDPAASRQREVVGAVVRRHWHQSRYTLSRRPWRPSQYQSPLAASSISRTKAGPYYYNWLRPGQ